MSRPAPVLIRMDVKEAAAYARRHPITIRRALEAGELHGSQRKPRAKWSIRTECVDAWLDGEQCPHRKRGAA